MRKASVVSMNSIFHHVGSNPIMEESDEDESSEKSRKYDIERQMYHQERPNIALPWSMIILSFVQIGLHLAVSKNGWSDALAFIPSERYQVWRYVTYMFVHVDALHLFSNILLQIIAGTILEGDQGHFRVLAVYFGGIVAGALGWSHADLSIVGCSSGSYALFFSQIPQALLNHSTIPYFKARISCLMLAIIAATFYEGYMILFSADFLHKVAISSHFFGCMAGIIVGFVIYRKKHVVIQYSFAFILFYVLILAIVYNVYRVA
ncbi:protein rhomboid [Culicoides brevitarsis]|uniref:protein rhomboid n=1 Tax=Culicoides brevitarsis TaxID=469753 RepID=UPI00307BF38F